MGECGEWLLDHSWSTGFVDRHDLERELYASDIGRAAPRTGRCDSQLFRYRRPVSGEAAGPMKLASGRRQFQSRPGFTLIEVTVALVVGLIALGAVVQLLIVQGRGYRKQPEVGDIRQTARGASALLAWDLRQAAAGGSRLATMGPNSLTIRSPRGVGNVCGKHPVLARYALWETSGNIQATTDDTPP